MLSKRYLLLLVFVLVVTAVLRVAVVVGVVTTYLQPTAEATLWLQNPRGWWVLSRGVARSYVHFRSLWHQDWWICWRICWRQD